jgi:23S rRNA pseudouridine2605 synthase
MRSTHLHTSAAKKPARTTSKLEKPARTTSKLEKPAPQKVVNHQAACAHPTQSCAEGPETMRLQKFLARAGVASRRHAEVLITEGKVSINGEVVTEMGTKVNPARDVITVEGKRVTLPSENATFMLHKPAGFVTTMNDPQERPTVAELIDTARYPSLFPVGRLDTDTSGLLLFTTDGELGHALVHPRRHVPKTYYALVEGTPLPRAIQQLCEGIELDGERTLPAEITVLTGAEAQKAARLIGDDAQASGYAKRHDGKRSRRQLETTGSYVKVVLREGRNRQIRRMFQAIQHPVIALHREKLGSLALGSLERGRVRALSEAELAILRCDVGGE